VTAEISTSKFPPANTLNTYWESNRESLMRFCEQPMYMSGMRGRITRRGAPIPGASLHIDGQETLITPDAATGFYHRLMMPGTYNVTVYAPPEPPRRWLNTEITGSSGKQLEKDLSL